MIHQETTDVCYFVPLILYGLTKVSRLHPLEMGIYNFPTAHPEVVKMFQAGSKWWTDRPTFTIHSQSLTASAAKNATMIKITVRFRLSHSWNFTKA